MNDGPYYVAQFDKNDLMYKGSDDFYYVFKYNIPILHFTSQEEANSTAYWLNQEFKHTRNLEKEINKLIERDEKRKEYQRTLESKIRRLKARIRVLEK